MKHARKDYDRFQDPEHRIPEDEPVFLLRAHDMVAPRVVGYWVMVARNAGADVNILKAAEAHARDMVEWQQKHGAKIPDMPED